MAQNIKSLVTRLRRKSSSNASGFTTAPLPKLFPKTDPLIDGEDCLHDCEDCTVKLPSTFKIDESDELYGQVNPWSTHLIVATGKTDWVRDVADEKGSVMEAVGKGSAKPTNGKLMLSASNIPVPPPSNAATPADATTVLLLPAFTYIDNVTPAAVPSLITTYINPAPTNTTPLPHSKSPTTTTTTNSTTTPPAPSLPPLQPSPPLPTTAAGLPLTPRPCPHAYLILLCSQRTRDARCGQSAPLLKREFERHLRPLGLLRDWGDTRPGGVGVFFISHVGGHKYSANCFVYRKAGTPGTGVAGGAGVPLLNGADGEGHANGAAKAPNGAAVAEGGMNGAVVAAGEGTGAGTAPGVAVDGEAAQCIWLARVRPEDCENIVRYTVLQGKVVKPERQLRGGFDRGRGLVSW